MVDNIFICIIMGLLSLDTVRALVAMTGWVKPEAKYAWIIYGRYERNLITTALRELGFRSQRSDEISRNLRSVAKKERDTYNITKKNAAEQLIILIAKYIVYFDRPIQYGGRRTTNSSYYIDTMEMAHDIEDKQRMAAIMANLYVSKGDTKKPEVIVTPKGGNPLFASAVADYYSADFIMAKSKNDKSRITSVGNSEYTNFQINYEGSWNVLNSSNSKKCVIVDCNTSGGSQLLDIVSDLRRIANNPESNKVIPPTEVYVLFRADSNQDNDIDSKFKDYECTLYRFFDLDEELKKQIYELKQSADDEDRPLDLYYKKDKDCIDTIIQQMKEKKCFFYDILDEKASMDIMQNG